MRPLPPFGVAGSGGLGEVPAVVVAGSGPASSESTASAGTAPLRAAPHLVPPAASTGTLTKLKRVFSSGVLTAVGGATADGSDTRRASFNALAGLDAASTGEGPPASSSGGHSAARVGFVPGRWLNRGAHACSARDGRVHCCSARRETSVASMDAPASPGPQSAIGSLRGTEGKPVDEDARWSDR